MNQASRSALISAFAIVSVSVLLRVYSIGTESYWVDEMVSLHFAGHSEWRAIFWDNAPFLYHALLKFWIAVAGELEVTTRLLSALFSAGATAVLMAVGFRFGGMTAALTFGFLHALCALSIAYGQETRMYAMLEFFSALNLLAWLKLKDGERASTLFFATSLLMTLTHYLALIPLAFECAYLISVSRGRSRAALLSACAALLTGAVSFALFFSWKHLHWQTLKFEIEPAARWPLEFFWYLGNKSPVVLVVLALLGAWSLVGVKARSARPLWFLFAGPLFLMTAAGFTFERATLLPRYLIFLVPVFVALTGLALFEMLSAAAPRLRYAGAALLAFFFAGSLASIPENYTDTKASWRGAAKIISNFPKSLVLTTKTEAVQTPYFTGKGVPLQRWDYSKPEDVLNQASRYDYVWIVDTYWNMKEILPRLLPILEGKAQVKDEVLKRGDQEALYVLQIRKPL